MAVAVALRIVGTACLLSQSVAVRGSILTVWACGGSTCSDTLAYWPPSAYAISHACSLLSCAHLRARAQAQSSCESGIDLDSRQLSILRATSNSIASDHRCWLRLRLHTSPPHKHRLRCCWPRLPIWTGRLSLAVLQLNHDILRDCVRVEQ